MQPRAFLIVLTLFLAGAGAANPQAKPRRRVLPPRPVVEVVAPPSKPAPPQTFTPLRLGGLPAVGDPAPACRAQCSKDRYVCHAAGDATDCDSRWIPCLGACSAR